jgi:hypothetical protein
MFHTEFANWLHNLKRRAQVKVYYNCPERSFWSERKGLGKLGSVGETITLNLSARTADIELVNAPRPTVPDIAVNARHQDALNAIQPPDEPSCVTTHVPPMATHRVYVPAYVVDHTQALRHGGTDTLLDQVKYSIYFGRFLHV